MKIMKCKQCRSRWGSSWSILLALLLTLMNLNPILFYLWVTICSFFQRRWKVCLSPWMWELTRETKSDVSCSQTSFTRRNDKHWITFGVDRHSKLLIKNNKGIIEILLKKLWFFHLKLKITINRRYPMQTETSQPRIMPATVNLISGIIY